MKKKIGFIINPAAGNKNKNFIPDYIQQLLDLQLFKPEIVFTKYAGEGSLLAKEFVNDGFSHVVAVGGDGTVNEIARSLIHTNTSLGILPIGSGNGLARHLKIPLNIHKAIQLLNNSESINIDYGIVNQRLFFCTCGTGFDAYVATEFTKSRKRGIRAYFEEVLKGYFSYRSQNYRLQGKNIDLEIKAFLLTFANASQWGNNAYIAPKASLQDGKMDISIMSNFPIFALPSIALQLFTKTISNDLYMITLRTDKITVYRDVPGPFHYDGEPYEEGKEIKIKIIPAGLKVLVKKRF